MTAIQYAKKIRCDWPNCQTTTEIDIDITNMQSIMPASWLNLRQYIVRSDGLSIGDICPEHAKQPISALEVLLKG